MKAPSAFSSCSVLVPLSSGHVLIPTSENDHPLLPFSSLSLSLCVSFSLSCCCTMQRQRYRRALLVLLTAMEGRASFRRHLEDAPPASAAPTRRRRPAAGARPSGFLEGAANRWVIRERCGWPLLTTWTYLAYFVLYLRRRIERRSASFGRRCTHEHLKRTNLAPRPPATRRLRLFVA